MNKRKIENFIDQMHQAIIYAGELAKNNQKNIVNIGKKAESLPTDTKESIASRSAKTVMDEQVQEILLKTASKILDPQQIRLDAEEETTSTKLFPNKNSEYTLILDPIDGTSQYIAGSNLYSICVGLLQKGQIVTSLIYYPISQKFYFIGTDGNAYIDETGHLNNSKKLIIKPSEKKTVYVSYRVPKEIQQKLEKLGYRILKIKVSWADAILESILKESFPVILYTPQIRDVLLGAVLTKSPMGYAIDWEGKNLVWPTFGRIPKVIFGVGKINKEIISCLM